MTPIAHFEKRYCITEQGIIINLATNTPLKPTVNPNGYLKVGLATGDGNHVQELLHILVAKHFIPNPYGHPEVNHKSGVKADCSKGNLEWVTTVENAAHALQFGLRPGYMSADDKEIYIHRVLAGEQVAAIATEINRHPNTLHKMLREHTKRMGIHHKWEAKMKENRKNAALRQLANINS